MGDRWPCSTSQTMSVRASAASLSEWDTHSKDGGREGGNGGNIAQVVVVGGIAPSLKQQGPGGSRPRFKPSDWFATHLRVRGMPIGMSAINCLTSLSDKGGKGKGMIA